MIYEVIAVSIVLAQKITTKTDLRCFEKPGPGFPQFDQTKDLSLLAPCACVLVSGIDAGKHSDMLLHNRIL